MVEQTYHKLLSVIVNELLHPFLAVFTPHVRLHKKLHWARLTSKSRSLWENKCCKLNIFTNNNKLILPFALHAKQKQLTLNLVNHALTWGFQSGCSETWLHWNNGIFIDDLNADVITQMASMFMNLKIDKINEILVVHKLLNTNQLKAKQTYIERSSFQCTSYLRVNESCYEGTLPLRCGTTLEEAASWVDVDASSWSASNDMLLSSWLLEELVVIMCSWCGVDFSLYMYINLMNIYIINFILFLNSVVPLLY